MHKDGFLFHFNPRGTEHQIVNNSTHRNKNWDKEIRFPLPSNITEGAICD